MSTDKRRCFVHLKLELPLSVNEPERLRAAVPGGVELDESAAGGPESATPLMSKAIGQHRKSGS